MTPEIVEHIVTELSKGVPLAVICREPGMPCDDTVRNWADKNPDVSRDIARARDAGHDAIAMRLRDTARGKGDSTGDVQRDKLIVETDLKLLAKWNPKKYGDRITHAGDAEAPIEVKHTGALEKLHSAIDRLASRQSSEK